MNETSLNLIQIVKQQQQQSQQQSQSQPQQLDSTLAISTLVAAQGNIDLAASRLNTTPQNLLSIISLDPQAKDILPIYIRTVASLYIFEALSQVRLSITAAIPDLQPYETIKAFTNLVDLLSKLTQSDAPTVNIQEMVLKMIPPEARQALLTLVENNSKQTG